MSALKGAANGIISPIPVMRYEYKQSNSDFEIYNKQTPNARKLTFSDKDEKIDSSQELEDPHNLSIIAINNLSTIL